MSIVFRVDFTQFLSPEGELVQSAPVLARDPEALLRLHRAMTLTRAFDAKAIALQRTGKLGTFASSVGQEAVGVGVASAMRPEDVLAPSYRDHGAQLLRGVTMVESLLYWSGDERGSAFSAARADFPSCVPIATQVSHAAGAAYAFKLRREPRVAVCLIGDGGTSKGDFYEALNLAAVWRAPLVVVINNNQWAISVPRSAQTVAQTLAQKAIAAGVQGHQVDGNDVIAVHEVARGAIAKAREGGGPSVIEALTYRLGDHTTADDATRYRDPEVVQREWAREPIARLRNYLFKIGAWDKERELGLSKACAEEVEKAVGAYLTTPAAAADFMFEHLFAALPESLQEQRETARRFDSRE
ncbi:MAG: pyruvate dehydrogenase (acetyl-transferring) E1 component subunit alpha [Beijerinckiaceae bacterium]